MSGFNDLFELVMAVLSLVVHTTFLLAGILAITRFRSLGSTVLMVGAVISLSAFVLTYVIRLTPMQFNSSIIGVRWYMVQWIIFCLGSAVTAAGAILIILRAAAMKNRLSSLEAIVSSQNPGFGAAPSSPAPLPAHRAPGS